MDIWKIRWLMYYVFCCGFVLYNGCNLKCCENFWNMCDNVYIYVFVILEIEICLNIKLYCLLNLI